MSNARLILILAVLVAAGAGYFFLQPASEPAPTAAEEAALDAVSETEVEVADEAESDAGTDASVPDFGLEIDVAGAANGTIVIQGADHVIWVRDFNILSQLKITCCYLTAAIF